MIFLSIAARFFIESNRYRIEIESKGFCTFWIENRIESKTIRSDSPAKDTSIGSMFGNFTKEGNQDAIISVPNISQLLCFGLIAYDRLILMKYFRSWDQRDRSPTSFTSSIILLKFFLPSHRSGLTKSSRWSRWARSCSTRIRSTISRKWSSWPSVLPTSSRESSLLLTPSFRYTDTGLNVLL